MTTDDVELSRLIYSQCQAIQDTVFTRAANGRDLTTVALGDLRRQLAFLVTRVEDAIVERSK